MFNGLLSAPANRKRDGILDILNAFSDSRFFLVGDSGEQDLELYAQIASERHTQILAVFIRDASGPASRPLDDPTGEEFMNWIIDDRYDRPQRWRVLDGRDGSWTAWRLIPEYDDDEYDNTDSEYWVEEMAEDEDEDM